MSPKGSPSVQLWVALDNTLPRGLHPHVASPPVPPVLGGAEPSEPGVSTALSGPLSGKDVSKFVGGFREGVWGAVELVDTRLGLECDLTGLVSTSTAWGEPLFHRSLTEVLLLALPCSWTQAEARDLNHQCPPPHIPLHLQSDPPPPSGALECLFQGILPRERVESFP